MNMKTPVSNFLNRLSIVQKSIIVGSTLLITNSIIFITSFNYIEQKRHFEALEDEGVATANSISEISKFGIITKNGDVLNNQLRGMLTKNIATIKLFDENNNLLAEADTGKYLRSSLDRSIAEYSSGISTPTKKRIINNDGSLDMILVGQPVEIEKELGKEDIGLNLGAETNAEKVKIGSVVVVMDHQQVHKELAKTRKTFAFLGLLAILLGIPLIVIFIRFTAGPLKKLVIATHKLSEGDLSVNVETVSMDEIGALAVSFNSMIQKLKATQEKLIMTERLTAAGRLAADMAHEMGNPLAVMRSLIYRAMKGMDNHPERHALELLDGEVDRLARILRQFNDFYRGNQLPLERVNVLEPLREVIDLYRDKFDKKGITIDERFMETGIVMANRDKLKQVFINIIKNAEESMINGGTISIEAGSQSGMTNIAIIDTGIGISSENLNRIFDPFFTTKGEQGTGLGLSVSYGIIKSFNGRIEVQSEKWKGAVFSIVLPNVV